jgi:energy-coupling factor transporter ATP-binding protein EcfA2
VSGGEGQRVAVARALVSEPRVLFADEPTGALDSLNGERVMRLLTAAAHDADVAVVLVTHEPRVAAYSDREVVVRDGRTRDLADRGMNALLLGARLALAGGRTRLALTAVGRRARRGAAARRRRRYRTCSARAATATPRARTSATQPAGSLLVADADTEFRRDEIRGRLLKGAVPLRRASRGCRSRASWWSRRRSRSCSRRATARSCVHVSQDE